MSQPSSPAPLEKRISKIEQRNARVEADKAWETSYTRRVLLVLTTYLVMSLFMFSINVSDPLKNAIIPTLGLFLSTLSLSFIKKIWLQRLHK